MSIISGILGAEASKDASDAQVKAANKASEAMLEMFYKGREDTAPWRSAGEWALSQLIGTENVSGGTSGTSQGGYWTEPKYEQQITGYKTVTNWDGTPTQEPVYGNVLVKPAEWVPQASRPQAAANPPVSTDGNLGTNAGGLLAKGPGEFTESPGYQFRLQEGINALDKTASARGRLNSGAQQKAIMEYGQNYASNEYGKFLDQYYQSLNPYLSMAGMGQLSAINSANNATSTGQNLSGNALYTGNAKGSGYINQANALAGAVNSGVQGYATYNALNTAPNYNWGSTIAGSAAGADDMIWL